MTLLVIAEGLLGYEVKGRYSGRVYFTSTDAMLARAVAEVFTSIEGMLGYEATVRRETCPHAEEVDITAFDSPERIHLCVACGQERHG